MCQSLYNDFIYADTFKESNLSWYDFSFVDYDTIQNVLLQNLQNVLRTVPIISRGALSDLGMGYKLPTRISPSMHELFDAGNLCTKNAIFIGFSVRQKICLPLHPPRGGNFSNPLKSLLPRHLVYCGPVGNNSELFPSFLPPIQKFSLLNQALKGCPEFFSIFNLCFIAENQYQ